MTDEPAIAPKSAPDPGSDSAAKAPDKPPPRRKLLEQTPGEVGGKDGPEPTRHGDWAHKGIVSDF